MLSCFQYHVWHLLLSIPSMALAAVKPIQEFSYEIIMGQSGARLFELWLDSTALPDVQCSQTDSGWVALGAGSGWLHTGAPRPAGSHQAPEAA